MKKLVAIFLVVIMVVTLAACGGNSRKARYEELAKDIGKDLSSLSSYCGYDIEGDSLIFKFYIDGSSEGATANISEWKSVCSQLVTVLRTEMIGKEIEKGDSVCFAIVNDYNPDKTLFLASYTTSGCIGFDCVNNKTYY